MDNLENKKVTEVPNWHEPLFTEFADLIFIELNTLIQCIPDRLHDLHFQIFPETCFSSMNVKFAAPESSIFDQKENIPLKF